MFRLFAISYMATLLISLPQASAEYRVFVLNISNKETGESREVTSTLDPLQYKTYYKVEPGSKITYNETWMCRGNTGSFKSACEKPVKKPAQPENNKK